MAAIPDYEKFSFSENSDIEMKILIMGTRGIPAKYGGFETFAEEMSVLLASEGYDVTVQCDHNSFPDKAYRGVTLWFTSIAKSDHPLRYYGEGFRWGMKNCDVIIAASSAASVFYPLNLFYRKAIITNPDGLEHKRRKWSFLKRYYLKISEMLSMRMSDYIIADSGNIKKYLDTAYSFAAGKTRIIEYGAYLNTEPDPLMLEKYGLTHEGYYLVVSRIEPENNIDMILEGYLNSGTAVPLIISGNIRDTAYVRNLVKLYGSVNVRFVGGVYDKRELNALRFSCKAYIHGHSVGGTNPSLLEAMANRNVIIAHDNLFNREVTDNTQFYFLTSEQCAQTINRVEMLTPGELISYRELSTKQIIEKYNWGNILSKYLDLLKEISSK